MGLNIKNEEVVALVRKLAARRGTDMTDAIRQAVQRELTRDETENDRIRREVHEIQRRVAALPLRDARPVNELIDEINEDMFE